MSDSTPESILRAVHAALSGLSGPTVARNPAASVDVPADGLVVLRDGIPGEPERVLGGVSSVYYAHEIPIEIYVRGGSDAARDSAFDALVLAVGEVLADNPTLGGLAHGMTMGWPAPQTESVEGGPGMKTGTLTLTVEYSAPRSV